MGRTRTRHLPDKTHSRWSVDVGGQDLHQPSTRSDGKPQQKRSTTETSRKNPRLEPIQKRAEQRKNQPRQHHQNPRPSRKRHKIPRRKLHQRSSQNPLQRMQHTFETTTGPIPHIQQKTPVENPENSRKNRRAGSIKCFTEPVKPFDRGPSTWS